MVEIIIKLGDIPKSRELGYKGTIQQKYIFIACSDCGKERWVRLKGGKPEYIRCPSCGCKKRHSPSSATRLKMSQSRDGKYRGENSPNWKGGKIRDAFGYILVKLQPDDFFYSMIDARGYVKEHRLIVAQSIGRNLHLWEIVHHKNHIRDDNRLDNLQLISDDKHKQLSILEVKIDRLLTKQDELMTEIKLLRSENKQLKAKV